MNTIKPQATFECHPFRRHIVCLAIPGASGRVHKGGPAIRWHIKVNQKSESISYRSIIVWTEKQVQFRSTFRTYLVSSGDPELVSMTTSDPSNVEVEIRPNCTSLIFADCFVFLNQTFGLYRLLIFCFYGLTFTKFLNFIINFSQ